MYGRRSDYRYWYLVPGSRPGYPGVVLMSPFGGPSPRRAEKTSTNKEQAGIQKANKLPHR